MDMLSDSVSSLDPTYEEMVDEMTPATAKLIPDWSVEKEESAHGSLDEQFLAGHTRPG